MGIVQRGTVLLHQLPFRVWPVRSAAGSAPPASVCLQTRDGSSPPGLYILPAGTLAAEREQPSRILHPSCRHPYLRTGAALRDSVLVAVVAAEEPDLSDWTEKAEV